MPHLRLSSPAKLNLSLQVVQKRSDGYHDLRTLFERIDLADDLIFTSQKDQNIRITCNDPQVPCGAKNLIYRVAQCLQQNYRVTSGVKIKIIKRIPVAAGLGGGSSNAATALLGLNKLWKLKLPLEVLVEHGRQIGSDVPFFLYQSSWALGTERGDKIEPLNLKKRLWQVLVVPRLKMYSGEVFGRLNLKLTKIKDNVNILIPCLQKNDLEKLKSLLFNDLEEGILKICPGLLNVRKRFETCGGVKANFSGSGPAVFAVVNSFSEAQALKKRLSRYYRRVYVVRTF
ncbi:MAG: 4-(cytidine 5'-diphospho)-2-C-methyl-D-erythritol kinase [Candidatus Omnitrophica bacterium]|nr:4-(cytidine 5'-diphospho)-2-C-methyl-D-erythritol kinase [Candidatus Omnitrophota bacterium]